MDSIYDSIEFASPTGIDDPIRSKMNYGVRSGIRRFFLGNQI